MRTFLFQLAREITPALCAVAVIAGVMAVSATIGIAVKEIKSFFGVSA